MNQALHLTEEGIQAILNIRASLNLGLSVALKTAFPKTIAIKRPLVPKVVIPHPSYFYYYKIRIKRNGWLGLLLVKVVFFLPEVP